LAERSVASSAASMACLGSDLTMPPILPKSPLRCITAATACDMHITTFVTNTRPAKRASGMNLADDDK
jgi:hypothetical protein